MKSLLFLVFALLVGCARGPIGVDSGGACPTHEGGSGGAGGAGGAVTASTCREDVDCYADWQSWLGPCAIAKCSGFTSEGSPIVGCEATQMGEGMPCVSGGAAGACRVDGAKLVCVVPECDGPEDCDDKNPCTTEVCTDPGGTCYHIPTSGHTQCATGWCLDGAGSCCESGCNEPIGDTFSCVSQCASGLPCFDGYCP